MNDPCFQEDAQIDKALGQDWPKKKRDAMTSEAQRIAIAEACGYRCEPLPDVLTFWTPDGGRVYLAGLPDYLTDLNAMHEAEKVLPESTTFWHHLFDVVRRHQGSITAPTVLYMVHATAVQRAEAFLRTIGKWAP